MALLKKIKSATLIEALVATTLIVIIFIIASLVLNNLLLNSFSKKNYTLESRYNQLEYQIINHKIQIPYQEKFQQWDIKIVNTHTFGTIEIIASTKNSSITHQRKIIYTTP